MSIVSKEAAVVWFKEVGKEDVGTVGGKGANLGELTQAGVPVPPGFLITAQTYFSFLDQANLTSPIARHLRGLDANNPEALNQASARVKDVILGAPLPEGVARQITEAYQALGGGLVAVRSSATAEDLPDASFAGQQATFLNVVGPQEVVKAVQACWASLYEPRAIFYRTEQGFEHLAVGIAVVVQRMVQAEAAGVMFTVEPVSNDLSKMDIEAVYGLGEALVSGVLTPDLFVVEKSTGRVLERKIARQEWKLTRNTDLSSTWDEANIQEDVLPALQSAQKITDEQVMALCLLGNRIEKLYGHPQDIEWAIEKGDIYVVQARAITTLAGVPEILRKVTAKVLLKGAGASPGMQSGRVRVVLRMEDSAKVQEGDVLVAETTTPDFVPIMKKAAAIVTDRGGRTAHAAIVSRELGIPCVVGTEVATSVLVDGQEVTVEGTQGLVYEGGIQVEKAETRARKQLKTTTRVYVNLADPELADAVAGRGPDGVGLLRAEFIIAHIGEHPRYMMENGRGQEWRDRLATGIEAFAKAFYPRPVVYRTSDLKTNEYRNLHGGEKYEGLEENPMIGYRGCSRYLREPDLFALEAAAISRVRQQYDNLYVMLPFVRTPQELREVKALLESNGLRRDQGMKLWMMAEVPSNVILLDQFLDAGIDGISIGSNDLTQLVLGVDRDNERLADLFDERNEAVLWALERIVTTASRRGVTCSICGQAPSFYPDLTERLVEWGITSVSVSPDMIERTRKIVHRAERKLGKLPQE